MATFRFGTCIDCGCDSLKCECCKECGNLACTCIQTVPCKWCGDMTRSTGTRECDGCHEVASRLEDFLQHGPAQRRAMYLLNKAGVMILMTDDYGMEKLVKEQEALE